jgi:hypothetical protein
VLSGKYNADMKARDMAAVLGRRGGRMRARRLSSADRKRIASLGGNARLTSLVAAERIASNFRYLAASRELAGRSTTVTRMSAFDGPLPGIYPAKS